jgi:hypothetical protein
MKKGTPHSDLKMNFSSIQRHAAEDVRKKILKYGKIKQVNDTKSSVRVQVISVTMMLVEYDSKEKTKKEDDKTLPGLAQVASKY